MTPGSVLRGGALAGLLLASGCSDSFFVCPEGILSSGLVIEDGLVTITSLSRNQAAGTIDDTPVSGCHVIGGMVYIQGDVDHLHMFDNLEVLGGILSQESRVGNGDNDYFPELLRVNGSFRLGAYGHTGMNKLRTVGGDMGLGSYVSGLQSLESIGGNSASVGLPENVVPNLRYIGGDFVIHSNSYGPIRMLPALEEIGGGLDIEFDGPSIELPALVRVGGDLDADVSATLESVSFPSLEEVDGAFSVYGNWELRSVSAPSLERVGELGFVENRKLSVLDGFPALTSVDGRFWVRGNWILPSDEGDRLVNQLSATPNEVSICGNLDDDPCS